MEKFKDIFLFAPKSKIKAGEGLDKGRFPFYTSSAIQNKWIDTEQHFDEALIFGTGGSASIHYESQPFSTSTDCFVTITTRRDVNTKYVYYFLSSNIHLLERGFKGAGLKHLSKAFLEEIEIPLPDLETQNKIVAILDKAKAILDKREESIKKCDELLKATFLEMFGDPLKNEKGWIKKNIQSLCSNIVDCPHTTPDYLETTSDYPCIRTSEIKNGEIVWKSMKYISYESYIKRIARLKPEANDIIFGREGTVGEALIIPQNLNISLGQRVMLFRVDNAQVNPDFFWSQLVSDAIQFEIKKRTIGATVKRINIGDLVNIEFIIPPIELQNAFSIKTRRIVALRDKIKTFQSQSNQLLASISLLSFKGELDFNTAVDLEVLLENDYDFFKENSNSSSIKLLIERLNTDELNENRFYEQQTYDKAKSFVFELIKEGKVKQVFDEKTKKVKLTV